MFSPQMKNYARASRKALLSAQLRDLIMDRDMIIEQMPLPTCLVDLDKKTIIKTNVAFQNFLIKYKLTLTQVPLPLSKLTHELSLIEEIQFKTPSNQDIVINLSTINLIGSEKPTTLVCFQDLTETKKLFDTSQIGFWNSDLKTGLTYICPTMAKDWGFDSVSVTAEAIMNAIHPDDRQGVWVAVEQAYHNNTPYHAEYRVIHPNGKIVWIESRGEYIRDEKGQPCRFTGTSIDVTHRAMEKANLQQELESQKELISRLKKEQEISDNANKNKTVFLANVSHEIRTPLTAILGCANLLKDGALTDLEKNQFIEKIDRNSNALIKIIDDVLDLSKVEANCLELEKKELSIQQLLQDVIHQFKDKARAKNIYLLLDIQGKMPQVIISDSVRLQQILSNLLSNAVKFTDQGGVIIQAKSIIKKHNKSFLEIKVIDTGIGLTEEQKVRLFQPFAQADSSTHRKFGGTGLGLALSKRIAETLGGELYIERYEKDNGCTFTLKLLVDTAKAVNTTPESKKQNTLQMEFMPLSGFKILLAEDSEDNQFFIEKFLSKKGATVVLANNGLEAIAKCEKEKFDAILMDIEMPQMDGYQATQALRTLGFKNPIIALTAHAMADEKIKTRSAGCNDHVTKPIDTQQLLTTLESHLKKLPKRNVVKKT